MNGYTVERYYAGCYAELIFCVSYEDIDVLNSMIKMIPNGANDITVQKTEQCTVVTICGTEFLVAPNFYEDDDAQVTAFDTTIISGDSWELEQLIWSHGIVPSDPTCLDVSVLEQFLKTQMQERNITDIAKARFENMQSDDVPVDHALEILSYLNCFLIRLRNEG